MAGDAFTRDLIAWQCQVVADRELTLLAFHVAFVLGQHVNRDSGDAWPAQARLCEMLSASRRGVQKSIDQLVERGHLAVTVQRGRNGSNRYRPILKNAHSGSHLEADNAHGGSHLNGQGAHGGSHQVRTVVRTNHLKEPSERGDIPPTPKSAFDRFWRAFPKHEAEDGARRAFDRLMRDGVVDAEQLVEAAGRYAGEVEDKHPDHIASAKNWLMDGRWKDPPRPKAASKSAQSPRLNSNPTSATAYLMARRARRLDHG